MSDFEFVLRHSVFVIQAEAERIRNYYKRTGYALGKEVGMALSALDALADEQEMQIKEHKKKVGGRA